MTTEVAVQQSPFLPHRQPSPFLPTTFAEVEHMANVMAGAKLLPPHFQKCPGDCILVIRLAQHLGMDPLMLAQECFSINGRLMLSGKLAAAVINTNGNLAERLRYEYSGEGDERKIKVIGRFGSEETAREVEVKYKDAKTNNEQWKKQPDQQLMYAGARTWGRRHVPELLLGVTFVEEADAIAPQPPRHVNELLKIQTPSIKPQTRSMDEPVEQIDPRTGEVLEREREKPHAFEAKTWGDLVEPLTKAILSATSIEEVDEWLLQNQEALLKMREAKPQMFRLFEQNIAPKKEELTRQ